VEIFEQGGLAIGLFDEIQAKKHRLRIGSGDRLMLVTDGMLDLVSGVEDNQVERLKKALQPFGSSIPPEEVEEALLRGDSDSTRSDDRCLVMVDMK